MSTAVFGKPGGKITIKSLDDGVEVAAHYNPKELQIDREVPWSPPGEADQANQPKGKAQKQSGIHQEFTGAKPRSLTIEMLFDGYEKSAADGFKVNVVELVGKLEHLATVIKPSGQEEERRPHWCVATWGEALRGFRCVITSLSTKYTMFDPSGKPLRATCTIKLQEADSVGVKGKK